MPPSMEDNSFSFSDQLRPCLYTCFPCLNQPSSSSSPSDHFPDSVHRALLEEVDDHNQHLPGYHLQPTSQLSRWDLFTSWLSSRTLDRLAPHSFDNDIQTSALPPSNEADALLLDDISIALQARAAHRNNSVSTSEAHAHTSHQPQPVPSPSVTPFHNNHRRKSRNLDCYRSTHPKAASQTSSPAHAKNSQIKDPRLSHSKDHVSSPSHKCFNKSRSKSSKQSPSACTDETLGTETGSLPSLITSQATSASSSASSSHPLELNVEIIKFIHQNYNQASRRLYGRDLSRVQIQQLGGYLLSKRFDDSAGPFSSQSCPATALVGIDTSHQKLDQADSLAEGFQSCTVPRPTIEIESLRRIQLSTTEFLQAIKQTKTNQHQLALDPVNTQNSGILLPTDDPFDVELEDGGIISSSIFDWFSKGSQITSELLNKLSANRSA